MSFVDPKTSVDVPKITTNGSQNIQRQSINVFKRAGAVTNKVTPLEL
jgi:hypothetical protein